MVLTMQRHMNASRVCDFHTKNTLENCAAVIQWRGGGGALTQQDQWWTGSVVWTLKDKKKTHTQRVPCSQLSSGIFKCEEARVRQHKHVPFQSVPTNLERGHLQRRWEALNLHRDCCGRSDATLT